MTSSSPELGSSHKEKYKSSDLPLKRDEKEKEEHRRAVEEALLGTSNNVPIEGVGMYQAFALAMGVVGKEHPPLAATTSNTSASSENRAVAKPITTDWTEGAVNGTHFWYEYDGSSMCALITPDKDCKSVGSRKPKVKCTACRMVIHDDCRENLSVKCRPTFREASHKKESWTQHHWVLRRKAHSSKCKECHKTLPKGPTWASNRSSKAFVAVSCSWCKDIYHTSCFKLSLIEDHCTLGDFEQIIIPPSWLVLGSKARSGGSKKGSKRKISYSTRPSSSTKRTSLRKRSEHEREENKRPFHIKVPSSATVNRTDGSFKTPLIVFVNPKSGGNQGVYLIQAFQWLLNPRQVFDLMEGEGGPTAALQLFQHVPNLRILVCGGDGTVGWILAEIDRLQFAAFPPVAVLPLGTGNDLARVLNWGGGYADEPLEKILFHVADGAIQALDRWEIAVDNMDSIECTEQHSSSPTTPVSALDDLDLCKDEPQEIKQLPTGVMNNYFSLGLDAYIQFQFHNSREANPEKFNSRAYNKFTYVKAGFVDTFEQKYKDLSRFLELVCDGEDLTEKIRDQKIHCLVFLNIPSYSAGAYPWGNPHTGVRTQSMDDGFMEVLGLSGAPNMAALQVGIRGVRLCQCRKATIISRRAVHCQVDGEPYYLAPSMICITRRNQARMIMKGKTTSRYSSSNNQESVCSLEPSVGEGVQPVKIAVHKVTYYDYNKHNGNITQLQEIALPLTMVVVRPSLGIDTVRPYVEKCVKEMKQVSRLPGCVSENWCFLHSSDGRLYPISNDMESQLPVQDMVATGIFVLDIGAKGTPKTVRDGSTKGQSFETNSVSPIRNSPDFEMPTKTPSYSSHFTFW